MNLKLPWMSGSAGLGAGITVTGIGMEVPVCAVRLYVACFKGILCPSEKRRRWGEARLLGIV